VIKLLPSHDALFLGVCPTKSKTIVIIIKSNFFSSSLITMFAFVGDDISVLWLADYRPHDISRICDANSLG
jgi:hypothetical protein